VEKEHYVVNRDSAYADPRITLKKLVGGNKRFIEGKSIKPRQDALTIKEIRKWTGTICYNSRLFRFPSAK
jgi:hypothetical protein